MKIGLQLSNLSFPGGPQQLGRDLRNIAQRTENAGFDSLWMMDHLFQIDVVGPVDSDMLECYSILTHLAAVTHTIKLGSLVTAVTYRNPGLLAKIVTSLDILSGGRAYLGLGAAWCEREHLGLGYPFPSRTERYQRLEETIQIINQMWSDNNGPYLGQHYQLNETLCVPQPIKRPPLLIGGHGEKKTLKLVARYAQACNLFQTAPPMLQRKLDVLKDHCHNEGTDYHAIEKTTIGVLDPNQGATAILDSIQQLHQLGIDHAIFGVPNLDQNGTLEWIGAEIVPHVHRLKSKDNPRV